ncbi:type II secretion system major pseudopilin GspG [Pseudoalteromonas xiamenensis]
MQRKSSRKLHALGFTMMELMIVIAILGLMASLVAPKLFGEMGKAKSGIAKTQMSAFEAALDSYRLDVGQYPETLDELRKSNNPRWDGPYLPKDIPLNPWDKPYFYKRNSDKMIPYTLKSLGADGVEGGEDENADVIHQ